MSVMSDGELVTSEHRNLTHRCVEYHKVNETNTLVYCEYNQEFALIIVIGVVLFLLISITLLDTLWRYTANRAMVRQPQERYTEMY